jgi:hypothetical protein
LIYTLVLWQKALQGFFFPPSFQMRWMLAQAAVSPPLCAMCYLGCLPLSFWQANQPRDHSEFKTLQKQWWHSVGGN